MAAIVWRDAPARSQVHHRFGGADREVAWQILAEYGEGHNLKERSLEVIRIYRRPG